MPRRVLGRIRARFRGGAVSSTRARAFVDLAGTACRCAVDSGCSCARGRHRTMREILVSGSTAADRGRCTSRRMALGRACAATFIRSNFGHRVRGVRVRGGRARQAWRRRGASDSRRQWSGRRPSRSAPAPGDQTAPHLYRRASPGRTICTGTNSRAPSCRHSRPRGAAAAEITHRVSARRAQQATGRTRDDASFSAVLRQWRG